jgi:Cu(I)/Ag(I) efflux system membrane fusion protein
METAPRTAGLEYQDQPAFAVEEARLNLLDLGFGEAQLQQIVRERKPVLDVLLLAPNDGTIVTRNAFAQQRFNRGAELFRIADLSRVWIVADLFGEDAHSIRSGLSAEVSLPDRPQERLRATVTGAQPRFDATTRALTVRLEIANPRLLYRPDMFVDVEFSLRFPKVISVPAEAVLDSGLRKTVFVSLGTGSFEARAVETGSRFDGRVEIVRGLRPGEPIAVSGTFLLDSETRMRAPAAAGDGGKAREVGGPGHD